MLLSLQLVLTLRETNLFQLHHLIDNTRVTLGIVKKGFPIFLYATKSVFPWPTHEQTVASTTARQKLSLISLIPTYVVLYWLIVFSCHVLQYFFMITYVKVTTIKAISLASTYLWRVAYKLNQTGKLVNYFHVFPHQSWVRRELEDVA